MADFAVILAAAGQSTRFRDPHFRKPFASLLGRAVWLHCVDRFSARKDIKQIILVISQQDNEYFHDRFAADVAILGIDVVIGGAQRSDSVKKGLAAVRPEIDWVAIHDAARPCVDPSSIDKVFHMASETGAAILATPITSTIKQANGQGHVQQTLPREKLWAAQTPQVFQRELLLRAIDQGPDDFRPSDDAQWLERTGHPVSLVEGSPLNLKITTQADLTLAAAILKQHSNLRMDAPLDRLLDDKLWR